MPAIDRMPLAVLTLSGLLCVGLPVAAIAQDPLQREIAAGKNAFMEDCASCHGADAAGDGPMADALASQPANLKTLRETNGDRFPLARTYAIIDGREEVLGHGSKDMPVWGREYQFDRRTQHEHLYTGARRDDLTQARILQLVYYLHSIQE